MDIPKVIHYCWFGGNPLPELANRCIESWKKYLPEYEIKEWNESNYDVHKNNYISQAYDSKKYAFVSDYARFDILYQYGGIYFDTDVEVLKDMSKILETGPFLGIEAPGRIATGLGMSAYKGMDYLAEILETYKEEVFIKPDGTFNYYTVVDRVSSYFKKNDFTDENILQIIKGCYIYPIDYFCPKDGVSGEIHLTENSCTIHHYDGSWVEQWEKDALRKRSVLMKKIRVRLIAKSVYIVHYFFIKVKNIGLIKTIRSYKKER